MSDIKINGSSGLGQLKIDGQAKKPEKGSFDAAMKEAFGKANEINNEAEKAIESLSKGGDVTEAVIAMQKADMSFQVMLEVRNKLLNAYEEIMRMQV